MEGITAKEFEEVQTWMQTHQASFPPKIYQMMVCFFSCYLKLLDRKQNILHLLRLYREAMGFSPTSEKGTRV